METTKGETERILSGKLKEETLEFLLKKAHDNRLTGKLSIKARDGFGVILFRDGRIILASTPTTKDKLGDYMVANGTITESEYRLALKKQKKNPHKRLESILLEEGSLSKERLYEMLKNLSENALFAMLFWRGVYHFEDVIPPDVPSEVLIDVDEFIEKSDRCIDDLNINIKSPSPSSESEKAQDYKGEIEDTIKHIARSLTTFKPREVVIVVEDEILLRTMLVDGLLNFGFEVEQYDNAKDAMKRIHELDMERISPAIVLDLMMTGLYDDKDIYGGMDLLNYITRNYPSVPVIISTSIDDPRIKLNTCFLGASYFLNKPKKTNVETDDFRSHIDQFIEELSFSLENIFRKQQAYLEKEQLVSVREELLIEFLKKGAIPFKDEADILGAKILFVDDEEEIRKLGEAFIRSEGFINVDIAENGKEAIKYFNEKKHDIVITDVVMPKKNGIEVLRYVKILSPNSQVIFITGYADKRSAVAAVKLGAFDYIEKPINFQELLKIIRRAVELKFLFDERFQT